jgi:acyl-CoA reductase-like NAD-dependent aldehyde dehydrogenase
MKHTNRLPVASSEGAPASDIGQGAGATLEESLDRLAFGKQRLAKLSIGQRIELLRQCIHGIRSTAREWVEQACAAKGIPNGSRARAEEVLSGPVTTMRLLQMFLRSMKQIRDHGKPKIPGLKTRSDGRLGVKVTPCPGALDPVVFFNFKATTWLDESITNENLNDSLATAYRNLEDTKLSLVLGAGNVSGIPASDVLSKLCVENRVVLLKMNPVNQYLAPIFERAFAPLIENDLLRIVCGDATLAKTAIADPRVDDVHITGSEATHEAIVWGTDPLDVAARKLSNDPILQKPISSELGNVTPWIVVPGQYSPKVLKFQTENIVASMTNNAAFNCVATRLVVTWKQWPERERFLQMIESALSKVPQRNAYYPGARDRYEKFTGMTPETAQGLLKSGSYGDGSVSGSKSSPNGTTTFVAGAESNGETLPWTFIRNVNPKEDNPLFTQECFACVCAEVAIDAESPEDFLNKATDFANERLWGTLAASITVPSAFRKSHGNVLDECTRRMRYGAVGINQWSAIVFSLMSPPWGGHPSTTLAEPEGGIGWVHNSLMLSGIEKTVLDGPLTVFPKAVWLPSHGRPEPIAWSLFDLFSKPGLWNVNKLAYHAVTGAMK